MTGTVAPPTSLPWPGDLNCKRAAPSPPPETTLLRGRGDLNHKARWMPEPRHLRQEPAAARLGQGAGNLQLGSQGSAQINGSVQVGGKFALGAGTDLAIGGSVQSGRETAQLQAGGLPSA